MKVSMAALTVTGLITYDIPDVKTLDEAREALRKGNFTIIDQTVTEIKPNFDTLKELPDGT
jgi:uncharacterized protein YccT (UPF0319 family)